MNGNSKDFTGLERRVEQRRKIPDRRVLIRFEPDKDPRRSGHGRRKGEFNDIWKNNER